MRRWVGAGVVVILFMVGDFAFNDGRMAKGVRQWLDRNVGGIVD